MNWELPLVSLAGLLGSAHCLGMCGPIALMINGRQPALNKSAARQWWFSCGRLFTYAFYGALAGFAGRRLIARLPDWSWFPALLAILTGLVMLYFGLNALGWLPGRRVAGQACWIPQILRPLLRGERSIHLFLAGMLTGALPCGLVYAFVALAANQGSLAAGAGTMLAFGVGTLPAMTLFGLLGGRFGSTLRSKWHLLGALGVSAVGLICIARGSWQLIVPSAEVCPLCSGSA